MLYQTELSVRHRTPGRTRTPINGSVDHRPIRWTTGVFLDFAAKIASGFKTLKSLQDLQILFDQGSLLRSQFLHVHPCFQKIGATVAKRLLAEPTEVIPIIHGHHPGLRNEVTLHYGSQSETGGATVAKSRGETSPQLLAN